jgi:SOS-response transcriptional repressor LexA
MEQGSTMDELNSVHAYSASDHTGTSVAVHAGFPNPATERTGAPLSLDKLLIKHPSSTYFFRIRGHNWHRYGVFDGDLAILDRTFDPRDGDLVIWWSDEGDFVLTSFARAAQQNIWGTVTAVIHTFRKEPAA